MNKRLHDWQMWTVIWRLKTVEDEWKPLLTGTNECQNVPIMFQNKHTAEGYAEEYNKDCETKVIPLTIKFQCKD